MPDLQDQERDHVFLHPLLDRTETGQDADPRQCRGQDHEDRPRDRRRRPCTGSRTRAPSQRVSPNWKPGRARVEPGEHQQRQSQATSAVTSAVRGWPERVRRQDRDDDRADQRRERDRAQQRERPVGHLATGSRSRDRTPAMTMQADGDAQRVVLDAAGLDLAQPASDLEDRRPDPFTVPSMIGRSNHHAAAATRPPNRTNSRSLSSSNHHLLSDARYRKRVAGVAPAMAGPRRAAGPGAGCRGRSRSSARRGPSRSSRPRRSAG